jgi:hypothetical protein
LLNVLLGPLTRSARCLHQVSGAGSKVDRDVVDQFLMTK